MSRNTRKNFLTHFISHFLAFEGDSQVRWFIGNYAMYEKDRKQRLGIEADRRVRPALSRHGAVAIHGATSGALLQSRH